MTDLAVLAIDQSSDSSGWCLLAPPMCPLLGVAKGAQDRRGVVHDSAAIAAQHDRLLVAVLEDHRSFAFSRGNMSVKSLLGMGAARGRWEQLLEEYGVDVHQVEPRVWRVKVLGLGASTRGDVAKRAAVLHAFAATGVTPADDAAEAFCMALWAQRNVAAPARRKARRA
jgi:Holliday junction resolvasome RuvABC endonuclease subunit